MLLPMEYQYGLDIAMKKLRPNAKFCLMGTYFSEYFDPDGLPEPTWQDIMDQIEKDKIAAEKWMLEQSSQEL